jgi:hypothetical protein
VNEEQISNMMCIAEHVLAFEFKIEAPAIMHRSSTIDFQYSHILVGLRSAVGIRGVISQVLG